MVKYELKGKRFGRLLVLDFAGRRNNYRYWSCKCDCGNFVDVITASLTNGHTVSCGCYQRDKMMCLKSKGLSAKNYTYTRYVDSARHRGIEFSIDFDTFIDLTSKNCFYCGMEPKQIRQRYGGTPHIYNGLDRVDNSKGYIINNVVPCCKSCNYKKKDVTIGIAKKMLEFLGSVL